MGRLTMLDEILIKADECLEQKMFLGQRLTEALDIVLTSF